MRKRALLYANLLALSAAGGLMLSACGSHTAQSQETTAVNAAEAASQSDTSENVRYENTENGGHALHADGESASYNNISIVKSGDSEGDEPDFYGENAAVLAENGAKLTISNADITTDGKHANGVFSYGEGTSVDISDSTIHTKGDGSGGLMTTGGASMNAENLNVTTEGNSSAPIRSDRGGGTVTVTGGHYESNGVGSPAIYSTADITAKDAELVSNASQGVVVEGKNSVTLENTNVTANHTKLNGSNSDVYQAVMLYQSMSGDADEGTASFHMTGGSLTSKNGGMFFVNNTTAEISLENVALTCATDDLLRIAKAGWGQEGSNGGNVTFTAANQKLEGQATVDDISTLNMYLKDGSSYTGAVNTDGAAGSVYVELSGDSTWTLTGDSYITSLTCGTDNVKLNGHTLYVNGTPYTEGTASEGTAVAAYAGSGNTEAGTGENADRPDGALTDKTAPGEKAPGAAGQKPNGGAPEKGKGGDGQTPPQKPADGQQPPEKPADGQQTEKPADGQQQPEKPESSQ